VGELAAIGIVTKDVVASSRFYRRLGLDVLEPPADDGNSIDLFAPL
jgi:hypothetical protein